MLVYNPEPLL